MPSTVSLGKEPTLAQLAGRVPETAAAHQAYLQLAKEWMSFFVIQLVHSQLKKSCCNALC